MGRFRIQLFLEDNTWITRYNLSKNDQYTDSSTEWTSVSLNFTVEKYGMRLLYYENDSPQCDMCFSKYLITHSLY